VAVDSQDAQMLRKPKAAMLHPDYDAPNRHAHPAR
jgi:hypothetical protein